MRQLTQLKTHEWSPTVRVGGWVYYKCIHCDERFFWNPRALYVTSRTRHDAPCWKQDRGPNTSLGQPQPMVCEWGFKTYTPGKRVGII